MAGDKKKNCHRRYDRQMLLIPHLAQNILTECLISANQDQNAPQSSLILVGAVCDSFSDNISSLAFFPCFLLDPIFMRLHSAWELSPTDEGIASLSEVYIVSLYMK